MPHRMPRPAFILLLLSILTLTLPMSQRSRAADKLTATQLDFFENKIRPVLIKRCYECHSQKSKIVKGGLLLDSRDATRKGGESGAAVVPGKPAESLLLAAIQYDGLEMPPKGKLPKNVIADFAAWVKMGAPDPRTGPTAVTSGIDFVKGRTHWAYQPITLPALPAVRNTAWPQHDLDHFTLAKLESNDLQPVAAADKLALIRRATFDLLGLPPLPADVDAFMADDSPKAFAQVIDRLLASEHYGERWGRYWLDVARYSEDQAHTFATKPNTNGFRYRDWVVSAFNRDMPYDQFVRLQIAGDLLGPTAEDPYEHLVALGFFGLGAQYYKNTDRERALADELDDRVDTLTRGFMGLTVSCARCHDHKFDPIPTQDYYSIAGIFRSSRLHNAPLCEPGYVTGYNDGQKRIKTADNAVKKFMADHKATAAQSKIGDIARYMEAVWTYQVSRQQGSAASTVDLAKDRKLNEYLLKRWISFLDLKNTGKVTALDAWFALDRKKEELLPGGSTLPSSVTRVTQGFQERIASLLNVKDGVASTNLVASKPGTAHKPGQPRFVTPLVTKVRPTAGIDLDITGFKQLYLVVSDGGNGKSCDHADWIAPRLVSAKGDELSLTKVKWKKAEGSAASKIDRNYQGKPIRVGGKTYPTGFGIHAPSMLFFEIPAGYIRFKATGGLDNSGSDQPGGCGDQASVQFSVYTETPAGTPTAAGKDLLTKVLGKNGPLAVADKDLEQFLTGSDRTQLVALKKEHEKARTDAPAMYAIAHAYTESKPADMNVFVRGNPANKRELAPRRFLRVIAGDDRPSYNEGSGRRQLALAISAADNPLTPRVIVNRVWQHHFGRGIVSTPSNFGKLGERPTHPQLLDYLARGFIDSGWSIKQLHREIMLSATYQLGTDNHAANSEIDADNRFLWRMNRRRLDVEAWRDALLHVSGRLDPKLKGPSTMLSDAKNVRRTVYAKISRHELDSLLRLFDFPDANITSAKRSETTVPQQQLFVLNSPFMVEQARSFAKRLHEEGADDAARITRAFQLAYGRPPAQQELDLGLAYLSLEETETNKLTRWERYAQVLLGANEFMYLD
jgi:hypothetical protein